MIKSYYDNYNDLIIETSKYSICHEKRFRDGNYFSVKKVNMGWYDSIIIHRKLLSINLQHLEQQPIEQLNEQLNEEQINNYFNKYFIFGSGIAKIYDL